MDAMTPIERRPIEHFLEQEDDAVVIRDGFVEAAVRALRGIQAIDLPMEDLLEPLREGACRARWRSSSGASTGL